MTTYQPDSTAERIIGAAIRVHKALGPGLLESGYQRCLECELSLSGITFRSEVALPIAYQGIHINCGYRVDLIVEDRVLVELKAVERLLPIHDAQVITYLKLTNLPRALLINFNVPVLVRGIKSFLRPSRLQGPGTSPSSGVTKRKFEGAPLEDRPST